MTRRSVAALAVALVLSACSAGGSGSTGPTAPGGGTIADATHLVAESSASTKDVGAAAVVVGGRLARMGAAVTVTVGPVDTALTTSAPVDAILREAAGRAGPTELWSVTSTAIGACAAGSASLPSLPAGRRCHTLGTRLTGVESVASARAALEPGIGWSVELFVESAGYATLRQALAGAAGAPVAVVSDRQVVAVVDAGAVLALHGRIGPGLTEREARRLAAALVVDDTSPVAFRAPTFGPEAGPLADADFWLAALSADVCGTVLPDAPATPDASGIHSHGDGFVYAHPSNPGEAGDNATLGRWLGHGSWSATADRLALWDGTPHRTGDRCPDGRPGVVRWWVDGVEQSGDPEKHRIGNGEAIMLSFNPEGVDPGPPPAAARLPLPRLTPEA